MYKRHTDAYARFAVLKFKLELLVDVHRVVIIYMYSVRVCCSANHMMSRKEDFVHMHNCHPRTLMEFPRTISDQVQTCHCTGQHKFRPPLQNKTS